MGGRGGRCEITVRDDANIRKQREKKSKVYQEGEVDYVQSFLHVGHGIHVFQGLLLENTFLESLKIMLV
jgi:hypothetical protein